MNKRRMLLLALVAVRRFRGERVRLQYASAKQQNVKAKWAGVESQLQRRADSIPNLV